MKMHLMRPRNSGRGIAMKIFRKDTERPQNATGSPDSREEVVILNPRNHQMIDKDLLELYE